MSVRRSSPDDPREWLHRARSSLQHARATHPQVYFEELCFDAQQAAEKGLKAVLLYKGLEFPYIHDLDRLLQLARHSGERINEVAGRAGELTRYAVRTRYPGLPGGVTEEDYREAFSIAESVVRWAEEIVLRKQEPGPP